MASTIRQKGRTAISAKARAALNVEFLKGEVLEERMETTIYGEYIPNTIQQNAVLAIDKTTGQIFHPSKISRIHRAYEIEEQGAIMMLYQFSIPNPAKQQVIQLPKGYKIFPTKIQVYQPQKLSAEAIEVLELTKRELYKPLFPALREALRNAQNNTALFARLGTVLALLESQLP